MNFDNFKPVNLAVGFPSVSITTNGVTFSKAAIVKVRMPEYVLLMINETDKQLAIIESEKDAENATPFVRNKKSPSVRYNNKDFLYTLEKLMGWDLTQQGYKAMGEYYSDENALVFNLRSATPITGRESEGDE